METLIRIAEQNGIAGLYFLGAVYGAYWLAENVAKPLVSAHLEFLRRSESEARKQTEWLESHAESLKELAGNDTTNSKSLERLANNYDRLARI